MNKWVLVWLIISISLSISLIYLGLTQGKDWKYSPQITMDENVLLITKGWSDCYLSVGLNDAQLYWKCDKYSAPIGVYVCSEEIAKEQLEKLKKRAEK